MLVENTNLTDTIATIKLVTGEEIITRVVEDRISSGFIRVVNPLAMVMMPGEGDQGMVAFAPWMLGIDDDTPITIDANKIIVACKARADASSQYSSAMGEQVEISTRKEAPQMLTGNRKGGRGR